MVVSGKLRRYSHLTLWQQLVKLRAIVLPNVIDFFRVGVGIVQSFVRLLIWRPDVVFCKGGFVCLPIGVAAHWLRIPLVIHDSDATPGLTNRVLSRWATAIGTGAPLEYYSYSSKLATYVGVPVDERYRPFSASQVIEAKSRLGFSQAGRPLLVVTGGSLGSARVNDLVVSQLDILTSRYNVILISGKEGYRAVRQAVGADNSQFKMYDYVTEGLIDMLGAADVVVARAGATSILELAALAKPAVLIPNTYLTGSHQVKNAKVYADAQAAVVLDELEIENDPSKFTAAIDHLIDNPAETAAMTKRFARFARPDAAPAMAKLVLAAINSRLE